jgi:1-acyl-sn-glycerol-3-phosphate acyltransferase
MLTRVIPAVVEPVSPPDFHDAGHGYDIFGLHPPTARRVLRWATPIYERYFRVASYGIEHVPQHGSAILVGNHAGVLPVDAAMLWADVYRRTGRMLRLISDRFIPLLPFVSTLFARSGVVSGTHTNVRRLLERGALLGIFPEGVSGPAKPFRDRYHIQLWRVGHAEHAIRHRTPIVPFAIIGAEESWPVLLRIPVTLFGAPYLPVPMSPLPLPARFSIHYGPPIELFRRYPPHAADDPRVVEAAATELRAAVIGLIDRGRAARGRS